MRQLNCDNIYLHKSKDDNSMTNVTMPKTNSRQKILIYLRKQGVATPIEIGKALRLTPANIRHHLSRLLSDGLVEVAGLRSGLARGRPHKTYRLSRLVVGDNLATLADALLSGLLDNLAVEEQFGQLRSLAERLASSPAADKFSQITRRLASAVAMLNQMHYQAHWEAHAAGPRMILEQCPYAAIIASHSELCLMDKFLLERSLAQPVEQLSKLERNERGLPVCIFVLR